MALNQPAPSSTMPASWDPTEDDVAPIRGRHRLAKQRTVGRGSTVLGVATMAAMGVGGVATAQGKSPVPISMPDSLPGITGDSPDLPEVEDTTTGDTAGTSTTQTSVTQVTQVADAGELLRTRILQQAQQQQDSAAAEEQDAAEKEAANQAVKDAAAKKVRDEAAAKKAAAEKKAAEQAEADRKAQEQAEADAAAAAGQFVVPTSNYTITATFGQAGDRWSANHTGLDFAAPSGTAVRSVAAGEITSAGWAGSFGYRIIVTHADGTETWYCHLSSMTQTSGTVAAGDTIGRVGATGNVTGPHLHLEVHPGGGDAIDPAAWLTSKGVTY